MAAKRYAVVLSDVHIGNGAPTCWYQSSVHERQLTEVLAWILARREVIREVVLLGDLFDVWTYPPSQRPPSMADIIAANRTLLGPSGPLAAVVRALPGRGPPAARQPRREPDQGRHRPAQPLARRRPRAGERIELIDGPWRVVDGASGARTVFSHGHHWCMFNAPDARSRWATIPVGPLRHARDRLPAVEDAEAGRDRRRPAQQRQPERRRPRRGARRLEPARRPRRLPARVHLQGHRHAADASASSCPTARRPPSATRCACSTACSPSG